MSPRSTALGTYNPSQVPKATLLAEFTARKHLLGDLLGILAANEAGQPCQHSLLIGPRGFGKTTTLYALKYRVEDEPRLSKEWLPLLFDEENYQIADLTGFWLECLRLAETAAIPTAQDPLRYRELVRSRDPQLERLARTAFFTCLDRLQRRALLLVDNLNDIFAIMADPAEQHRLRACLLEESRLCVVGTACTYFEAIAHTDRPFYNLFRTFRLDRFTKEEMRTALQAMWHERSPDERKLPMPEADGYWRGLHILTGGNPRLVKMIFQLLEQGVTADFRAQLEGLLDAYTPYFKHRIESMSPQQRRVFDAIALAWDPVGPGEIAPALRMESNQVSAQIRSLVDAQLVAIAGGTDKRRTYQIADRFSNIHYFMRFSRAGRSKFEWFIRTMKVILGPDQYRDQLERMRAHGLNANDPSSLFDQVELLASATCALDDPTMRRSESHKSVAAYLTAGQEAALKHLLEDPALQEALGDEHATINLFSKLPKATRKEVGYRPDDPRWWSFLAEIAKFEGHSKIAATAYRRVVELDPGSVRGWMNLRVGKGEAKNQDGAEPSQVGEPAFPGWGKKGRASAEEWERWITTNFGLSWEIRRLASKAVIAAPAEPWAQYLFRTLAIKQADFAETAAEALASQMKAEPEGSGNPEGERLMNARHSIVLDCLHTLIDAGHGARARALIERTETSEIFDIPLQAIKLRADPKHRERLAKERLALVEAFLEKHDSGC